MSAVRANTIDPISVEVIGSALSSIVEEMGEALVRASFSTNIKERRDCSTALFDMRGTTLCQAEHIPMHLGSFIGIIPEILKRHPAEKMQPGDVFIGNDAYAGAGTHLPDIVLGEPIFVEGRIVAWAVNTAHHADFADRGHAHIYQEGLRIPPIRLYRAGELQSDVQELILLNCQVPRERLSDLRAQMAANRLVRLSLPRPAGGQGRRRMTPAAAPIHLAPAGGFGSWRRTAIASSLLVGAATPSIGRNSHHHHRLPRQNPLIIGNGSPVAPAKALPAEIVVPSNPPRRQPPTRRPAGSFLGGFRTPAFRACTNSCDGPASETLHPNRHHEQGAIIAAFATANANNSTFMACSLLCRTLARSPRSQDSCAGPGKRCR
jgi:hypothetical protein